MLVANLEGKISGVYCKMFGNSSESLMLKKLVTFCKHLVSKASRSRHVQVSVSSRLFAQNFGLITSMSRLGLEDFGRDYSSV